MSEAIITEFKFTKARLEQLAPADKAYRVKDTGLKGLICRVRPSGSKSLEVYKKPKGSNSPVCVRICAAGDLPIEKVYTEAYKILSQMREGANPNEAQKIKAAKRKAKV